MHVVASYRGCSPRNIPAAERQVPLNTQAKWKEHASQRMPYRCTGLVQSSHEYDFRRALYAGPPTLLVGVKAL